MSVPALCFVALLLCRLLAPHLLYLAVFFMLLPRTHSPPNLPKYYYLLLQHFFIFMPIAASLTKIRTATSSLFVFCMVSSFPLLLLAGSGYCFQQTERLGSLA